MKKTILFILSFLFVTSMVFADNMVLNPGFEDWTAGSPDTWTTSGGASTLTENTILVHGGSSSCELEFTSTTTANLNSNTFSVTEGSTISVSVWMYDDDIAGRGRLTIQYTDGANFYGDYSSDQDSWQQITYSGTVPSGATAAYIQFRFYDISADWDGDCTILIDDVIYDHPVSGALAITNVSRQYPVPTSSETCWVQCDATGGTAPYTANIKWDLDGVSQTDISMSNTGGDTYQGTIPAQSNGARVEYYIEVTDSGADATETSSTYGLFWGTSNISNVTGNIKAVDVNNVMLYDGYYARVTGIATVASGVYSTSSLEGYLQDGNGGINLYKGGAGTVTITEGNNYTAFGILDQYNGKAELIPNDASTDITDNGAGTMPSITIKTIAQLLADPETYEGMLIGIQHLSKASGTWGANQNLVMTDDGGTNTFTLRIDGDTDLDENAEPTWPKDVQGIMGQYDSSSPFDSGYQILPRRYTDIVDDGVLPVNLSAFYALYIGGTPTLYWTTQSETENAYWNVYRGTNNSFTEAVHLNADDPVPGNGTTNSASDYVYIDNAPVVQNSTYWYWIEDVSTDGETVVHEPITLEIPFEDTPITPDTYGLHQNYPNPFNPSTSISFALEEDSDVELIIYNVKGAKIRTIFTDHVYANDITSVVWDGNDVDGKQVSSGVYFYKLITETKEYQRKMLLVK